MSYTTELVWALLCGQWHSWEHTRRTKENYEKQSLWRDRKITWKASILYATRSGYTSEYSVCPWLYSYVLLLYPYFPSIYVTVICFQMLARLRSMPPISPLSVFGLASCYTCLGCSPPSLTHAPAQFWYLKHAQHFKIAIKIQYLVVEISSGCFHSMDSQMAAARDGRNEMWFRVTEPWRFSAGAY